MKKEFDKIYDNTYYLTVTNYVNNGRMYIGVSNQNDELYTDITINLSELNEFGKDFVFLSNDLDKEIIQKLRDKDILSETLYEEQYNMGSYKLVNVNLETLKEYDPKGVEEFLNAYNKIHNDEMER